MNMLKTYMSRQVCGEKDDIVRKKISGPVTGKKVSGKKLNCHRYFFWRVEKCHLEQKPNSSLIATVPKDTSSTFQKVIYGNLLQINISVWKGDLILVFWWQLVTSIHLLGSPGPGVISFLVGHWKQRGREAKHVFQFQFGKLFICAFRLASQLLILRKKIYWMNTLI